jgi:GntR family transcriptional regulator, rspAB operon transcriptional repressor
VTYPSQHLGQSRLAPVGRNGGRRKLTDWVYDELKSSILDLRLRPGDALRETAIAEALGTSKTPVREALALLEMDGLVETEVFKGAVVSGYSHRDLEEIYELRLLVEVQAARKAAESMDDDMRKQLQTISEESRQSLRRGHTVRLAQLIDEFDSILFEDLENRRIRAIIANLRDHLIRIGHLTQTIPGRMEASVYEHDHIIQAIVDSDPEMAGNMMRSHILSVKSDQLAALEAESLVVDEETLAPQSHHFPEQTEVDSSE